MIDSDGTLILSHGSLTGGSVLTEKLANQHGRPCLHIDLNETIAFTAALKISTWVKDNSISVLNVAGPRASKDAVIYDAVTLIISAFQKVLNLGWFKKHMSLVPIMRLSNTLNPIYR